MTAWEAIGWDESTWGDAMAALARASGLATSGNVGRPPVFSTPAHRDRWIESAAHALGIEAEPVDHGYGEIDESLASIARATSSMKA